MNINQNLLLLYQYDRYHTNMNGNRFRRCGSCNGTGKELETGIENCAECIGTGRNKRDDWNSPCPHCRGSGRVVYTRRGNKPCRVCNGSGTQRF